MTVFGHTVLFDCVEKREDTASPKTPKQWYRIQFNCLTRRKAHARDKAEDRQGQFLAAFDEAS